MNNITSLYDVMLALAEKYSDYTRTIILPPTGDFAIYFNNWQIYNIRTINTTIDIIHIKLYADKYNTQVIDDRYNRIIYCKNGDYKLLYLYICRLTDWFLRNIKNETE